jgi:antirestriction protein ArdC
LPEREIVPQAEALATATRANIRIGGARAFDRPMDDTVHIPPQPAFFEQINYYRTLFHELGHWAALSIRPTVRHADYLGSWLKVLREDSRAIFRAASKASKAADFLLAFGASASVAATEVEVKL